MRGLSGSVYSNAALIDTSAVLALFDERDQFHQEAKRFFDRERGLRWLAVDVTAHEAFTRTRYA